MNYLLITFTSLDVNATSTNMAAFYLPLTCNFLQFLDLPSPSNDIIAILVNCYNKFSFIAVGIYNAPNTSSYRHNYATLSNCLSHFKKVATDQCIPIIIMGDFNYPNINWKVGSYRHNYATLSNCLSHFKKVATDQRIPIIIMGDFNYPNINWKVGTGLNEEDDLFINLVDTLQLNLWISTPTHSSGNILDLLITDGSCEVDDIKSNCIDHFSDHYSIEANLHFNYNYPNSFYCDNKVISKYSTWDIKNLPVDNIIAINKAIFRDTSDILFDNHSVDQNLIIFILSSRVF